MRCVVAIKKIRCQLFSLVTDTLHWPRKGSDENADLIHSTIISDDFWTRIDLFVKVLEPLHRCLTYLEGYGATPGDVYAAFVRLDTHFRKSFIGLTLADETYMLERLHLRFRMIITDIHTVSYIMDHRYAGNHGVGLTPAKNALKNYVKNRCNAYKFGPIPKTISDDDINTKVQNVIESWGAYERLVDEADEDLFNDKCREMHPLEWAKTQLDGEKLKPIKAVMLEVHALPSGATSNECNWSVFGNVVSKKRNRLTVQRQQKLVHIYYNSRAHNKMPVKKKSNGSLFESSVIVVYFTLYILVFLLLILHLFVSFPYLQDEFKSITLGKIDPDTSFPHYNSSGYDNINDDFQDMFYENENGNEVDEIESFLNVVLNANTLSQTQEEESYADEEELALDFTEPTLPCPGSINEITIGQSIAGVFDGIWVIGKVVKKLNPSKRHPSNIKALFFDGEGYMECIADTYNSNAEGGWVLPRPQMETSEALVEIE